ncbi:MAG: diaminopimelate epimerase, partial [Elusimicrobia bacterium RIFOXYB2_FULL_48_7]
MKFTKMQGAGNDFIIIDNRKKTVKSPDYPVMAKNLCRQRFSIGADGLIFVEKPQNPQTADFSMVFINSDGSFADMCGNGARCLAYYAFVNGIVLKLKGKKMAFETGAGIIKATAGKDKARITLPDAKDIKLDINLKIENREIQVSSVNTGVPHAVIISQDV